jgi:protoheme IX farnesyltransferase
VAALLIFLAYGLWQMPHSWAIAIYRFDDYKNAGIPILPVARSIFRTKVECVIYIVFLRSSQWALLFWLYQCLFLITLMH